MVCLLLAYLCAQARRFMRVPFAPGLLLACSWPALSALCLASFWPFCCTGAVVSARLACSVWPAAGPLCLAYVVWVWPAVPGPWPQNRQFLIEPREECQLFPTKVQLPGLFLDNDPCNLQRIWNATPVIYRSKWTLIARNLREAYSFTSKIEVFGWSALAWPRAGLGLAPVWSCSGLGWSWAGPGLGWSWAGPGPGLVLGWSWSGLGLVLVWSGAGPGLVPGWPWPWS